MQCCVRVSLCVHRFGIERVLAYWPVCINCLGTNCAESTAPLCGWWSCLKVGLLMNRSFLSWSGASSLWGFSSPRHVTMTGQSVGCWWECRVFSIINSCCIGLPRSRQVLSVCVCLPVLTYVCMCLSEDA